MQKIYIEVTFSTFICQM